MLKCLDAKVNRGFTLVELLVTITIFLIVIGGILGIFIAGLRQQTMALNTQVLLDQTSFALEYMGRALRMAKKELSFPASCLTTVGTGYNYEIPPAYRIGGNENLGTGIRFINILEDGDCQEFFLEAGQLKYWKQSTGQTLPLTSNKLEITSLRFNLIGAAQSDNIQPRASLFFEVKSKQGMAQKIKIQTTLSQRNLDVVY